MPYIESSLVAGETLLHRARVSWWTQVGLLLLAVLTFGIAIAFGVMATLDVTTKRVITGVIVLIGLAFILRAWIRAQSTELAITNRRVIAKFGFVQRHTIEINLEKVEALRVDQGFLGRILNFGTIHITGSGGSVEPIPQIADPLVFRRKFMEATSRPLATSSG
jgi:membrane protein YdbS with pleckstrin-like domain